MENITGRSEGVTRQLIPPPPPSFIHECILSYSTEEVQTRKQLERSFLQALVGLRDGIYTADPGSIDQRWGLWALNRYVRKLFAHRLWYNLPHMADSVWRSAGGSQEAPRV